MLVTIKLRCLFKIQQTTCIISKFQDTFVEYFQDHGDLAGKIWKGVLFTAIGLGAVATVVASR